MTPDQFVLWLKGFFEIVDPSEINSFETKAIRDKLYSIFDHVVEPVVEPNRDQAMAAMAAVEAVNKANLDKAPWMMSPEEFEAAGRPRC